MGISVTELKTLALIDAAALINFVAVEKETEARQMRRFLKSKKGAGVQPTLDISQAGKW